MAHHILNPHVLEIRETPQSEGEKFIDLVLYSGLSLTKLDSVMVFWVPVICEAKSVCTLRFLSLYLNPLILWLKT